jgi:hypothetical protein
MLLARKDDDVDGGLKEAGKDSNEQDKDDRGTTQHQNIQKRTKQFFRCIYYCTTINRHEIGGVP